MISSCLHTVSAGAEPPWPSTFSTPKSIELAARLAKAKGVTKTQAVKGALLSELERQEPSAPFWERLQPILDRIAARPDTGLVIDKAFFDDLSGEDER